MTLAPLTPPSPRLHLAAGPRLAEARLLELVAAKRPTLAALPLPTLRIVVPSASLRLHLAATLVRPCGAVAGVMVQTLFALAIEVLERAAARSFGSAQEWPRRPDAGQDPTGPVEPIEGALPVSPGGAGGALLAVLVRRLAHDQPALRALAGLADGYGAVVGTVRDLLDAGVDATLLEPLGELLASDGPAVATADEVARAHALVRTAGATDRVRQLLGLTDSGSVLRRAATRLASDPALLAPGPVLVHGFGEATGAATSLLTALVQHRGADVVIDLPAEREASGSSSGGPAHRFTGRLRQALQLAGAIETPTAATPAPPAPVARPRPEILVAVDPDAEVREVARRIRLALDGAAQPGDPSPERAAPGRISPEEILVTARDLAPYRTPIRRHFGRLGIPFSDLGANGPPGPQASQLAGLAALLGQGGELPAERWLDLVAGVAEPVGVDVRLALAVLGAGRLRSVATLELVGRLDRQDALALPIRRGIVDPGGDPDAGPDLDAEAEPDEPPIDPTAGSSDIGTVEVSTLMPVGEAPDGRVSPTVGQLLLPLAAPAPAARPTPAVARPATLGLRSSPGADRERGASSPRRRVAGAVLRPLVTAARALCAHLDRWPAEAPWRVHAQLLTELLELLGWQPGAVPAADRARESHPAVDRARESHPAVDRTRGSHPALDRVLDHLARTVPPDLPLRRGELGTLLTELFEELGSTALGGAGSGVQVLTVTEARGRTANQLFVLGMARGGFPRPVREDALLSDALRRRLRVLLPDLPVKGEGHDEERVLFAQLQAAAPHVTLSWPTRDSQGRPLSPSPLLAGLPGAAAVAADGTPLDGPLALASQGPHTALEELARAGLHGSRAQVVALLPAALAEGGLEPGAASALATVRAALLDELDPDLRTADGRRRRTLPGPFQGFVGRRADPGERQHTGSTPTGRDRAAADPRHRPVGITTLEALAVCPWQVFLRRLLGLVPPPDALGVLPAIDSRLLGSLVHRVLEAVVRQSHPWRLSTNLADVEATAATAVPTAWPGPGELGRLVRGAAAELLRAEGRDLPGLAVALAVAAEPYLEVARQLDWGAGPLRTLGAEVRGELSRGADGTWAAAVDGQVTLDGGEPSIVVRADLLDLAPDGLWRLTDYKIGRLPGGSGRATVTERVQNGAALQAPAYLLVAGRPAVARYAGLDPAAKGERELVAQAEPALTRAFGEVVDQLIATWLAGQLSPRLVDRTGRAPKACRRCEVRDACNQGDSGARARLERWLTPDEATNEENQLAPIRAVWQLGGRH